MRTASHPKRRPDDLAVIARQRGAFVDNDKAKLKTSVATAGRPQQPRAPPVPLGAYSVAQFCEAHGISQSFFFKLQSLNQGPVVMRLGARTLISVEAAAAWRAEREADTAKNSSRLNEEAPPPSAA